VQIAFVAQYLVCVWYRVAEVTESTALLWQAHFGRHRHLLAQWFILPLSCPNPLGQSFGIEVSIHYNIRTKMQKYPDCKSIHRKKT